MYFNRELKSISISCLKISTYSIFYIFSIKKQTKHFYKNLKNDCDSCDANQKHVSMTSVSQML
jgi:Ca2+/H+ antiporter